MSAEELRHTDERTIRETIECDHCGHDWETDSKSARPTCPSCQRKTDRQVKRAIASVPTKWISDGDTLDEVADLLDERAEVVRELYEHGWRTDMGLGGPNTIRAEFYEEDEREPAQPIDDERWNSYENESPSDGIGLIDYVGVCRECGEEVHMRHKDWSVDGKIVAEDEMLCRACESVVQKNMSAITYSEYPKNHFRHVSDLRTAALRLRGTAGWYRALQRKGWYLVSTRDQYLHLRYDVNDAGDVEVGNNGHLKELA
jgi:hypothetical protein